jgi:hypothetical protein
MSHLRQPGRPGWITTPASADGSLARDSSLMHFATFSVRSVPRFGYCVVHGTMADCYGMRIIAHSSSNISCAIHNAFRLNRSPWRTVKRPCRYQSVGIRRKGRARRGLCVVSGPLACACAKLTPLEEEEEYRIERAWLRRRPASATARSRCCAHS